VGTERPEIHVASLVRIILAASLLIQLSSGTRSVTVEVLDMAGRVVRSASSSRDRIALTLDMNAGSYAFVLRDASARLLGSGRVIVR
jgi:hypothetical protein